MEKPAGRAREAVKEGMAGVWRELFELTRVRVILFRREPEAVFWVFFFPLVLAAVLGFAFRRGEVEPSRVAVLPGPGAAELVARLDGEEHLEAQLAAELAAAEAQLRRGALDALVVPGTPPRLRFDPTRPEAELTRLKVLHALTGGGSQDEAAALALEPVTAVGSRYIDFLFPGLLGLNLMGTGMWSIGFAVADMRQKKILKRLRVTPMRRSSFLLAFLLARLVFLVAELTALVAFGVWVLGVPFRAGPVGFLLLCLLGAMVFSGLGMLAVSRTRTVESASGMLNLAMIPMWLASGVFFSYERFPAVLHPLVRLLPLTALNDALRALMLEGTALPAVGAELAVLATWGLAAFLLGVRVFRWE